MEGHPLQTFIPYVKCDTKEAEDLCGKYGIRTGGVKCLCRYCDIPLNKGDRHLHECRYKTEPEIKKMVQENDLEGLKLLSQHHLWNAFWDLPFNAGNKRGIHGGMPNGHAPCHAAWDLQIPEDHIF